MSETDIQACWREIGYAGDRSCHRLDEFMHCHNCPVFVQAGHSLLDREPPEGYLQEAARHLAQSKPAQVAAEQSAVVFRLNEEWVGLPTSSLVGVFEERVIRPVPHRGGKLMLGVSVAQGQISPCVSLHGMLGLEREDESKTESVRVFKRFIAAAAPTTDPVILPVDEVYGVVRFNERSLAPAPATVTRSPSSYTKGVLELSDMRVSILDEELFFNSVDKIIH
jgi:chemotaxis-related protein WspD